jgi:hypothetical protein
MKFGQHMLARPSVCSVRRLGHKGIHLTVGLPLVYEGE